MFDWNDVRHFLAVARGGSTLTAAQRLNVSQPTVARRVAALEAALGVTLFERRQAGYRLTTDGEALLPAAEALEQGAAAVADAASARTSKLQGVVKLTCNEMSGTALNPLLGALRDLYPGIRVDLIATEAHLDLGAGEADIAIRTVMSRPQGPGLYARKIVHLPAIVYCSRAYADTHGVPRDPGDLAGHVIVGAEGYLTRLPGLQWLEEMAAASGAAVTGGVSSLAALAVKVRGGVGIGAIPWGFYERDPQMIPCFFIPEPMYGQIWLVTHERARKLPQVRAVLDYIASVMEPWARRARAYTIPPPA